MSRCSGCGMDISCPDGCGLFCTSDCSDCTRWCEPTHVREDPVSERRGEGTLIRTNKHTGEERVIVGSLAELPASDLPPYSDQTDLIVSFNDIPRASVARLLGYLLGRSVRTAPPNEDERISGSYEGTVAEIMARYSLAFE